jgi:hypothetical protein
VQQTFVLHTQNSTAFVLHTQKSAKKQAQKSRKKVGKKDNKKGGKRHQKRQHKKQQERQQKCLFMNLFCCCLETGLKPISFSSYQCVLN